MDLGRVKLLRSGVNALQQAIHPVHGLAWTDGRQVILTALQLQKEEAEFGSSVVIGQFEHVHGLSWGPATDALAHLAVQHKKRVTTWQLYYNPLEKNKLVVSQTCEYGDPLPILPQGCVWHPKKNILVVLTKRDISVLYSACYNNNNVKADITGSSAIRCACWAKDGNRMVVAMDDSLHSYIWNDDQKTLSPCSFCPIFNIDAAVVAIQPIMDCQVVVTVEMAAKSPYNKIKDSDGSALQSSLLTLDEELSRNSRRMSIESGKSEPVDMLKVSSLVPDVSQILARHRKSDPSPLTHFKPKNVLVESKPELSSLVIISFEKNATTTRTVSLPGISTPDILVLDSHGERVAVASNTCNLVLIYPIAPSCMPNIQQIKLEENEIAKGVSFLSDTLLLILVGRQRSNDVAFLPVSASDKYMVQLVTRTIMPTEYIPARSNCGQNIIPGPSSLPTAGCKQSSDEHNVSKEFWMPNHIGTEPPCARRKSADNTQGTICQQSPASSLDDLDENKLVTEYPVTIEKLQSEPTILKTLKVQLSMPKRTLHRSSSQRSCSSDSQEARENHLPTLNKDGGQGSIDLGHREPHEKDSHLCSSEVNTSLKNCLKTLPHPSSEDPPYISVRHQKSPDHGVNDMRAILLCHGHLHLRTLREIFHLDNIEMKFGSKWIILTEDGDGFVPITFRANQEVAIREAKDQSESSVFSTDSGGSTVDSENM
ncbi:WD repeat and coiled-coil-containing protein-like [Pseudophryne corroboree]|uniref:WD repeat and coiled-coil-containing protein-like n=1 Tax=Pseudophryne corroboree TaxID=495146 RepID=UPI0030818321